ncbi:YaeQ family protein [Thalassotalea mangrovi]|uniref:YaeQ family protein n=1 Tax=Thalassotalea mangrovi TaxID=2572245 RepID=A0A4U1B1E6_9GAMM|nr:YaeQ family protein [Thalassotalea mangrovi]TKB43147.1 YaeQ family protein [Thalassotalea mangrovi]
MAQKSIIYKASIQVSDLNREQYPHFQLTIARHPSETERRLMLRLLAFAHQYDEQLQLCKGISTDEEPDLWIKNYSEEIELWVELGQLDEKRLKKASNRARQVVIYCYGSASDIWWQKIQHKASQYNNVSIWQVNEEQSNALAQCLQRTMELQFTIDGSQVWVSDAEHAIQVDLKLLQDNSQTR